MGWMSEEVSAGITEKDLEKPQTSPKAEQAGEWMGTAKAPSVMGFLREKGSEALKGATDLMDYATTPENWRKAATDVVDTAKFYLDPAARKSMQRYGVGAIGQVGDMTAAISRVVALPFAIGVGGRAVTKNASSKEYWDAMLYSQENLIPAWAVGAYGRLAKSLGPEAEAYYNDNGIGKFMQKFGEEVEAKSAVGEKNFGIPASMTKFLVNSFMDIAGNKMASEVANTRIAQPIRAAGAEARARAEAPFPPESSKPDMEMAKTPYQRKIEAEAKAREAAQEAADAAAEGEWRAAAERANAPRGADAGPMKPLTKAERKAAAKAAEAKAAMTAPIPFETIPGVSPDYLTGETMGPPRPATHYLGLEEAPRGEPGMATVEMPRIEGMTDVEALVAQRDHMARWQAEKTARGIPAEKHPHTESAKTAAERDLAWQEFQKGQLRERQALEEPPTQLESLEERLARYGTQAKGKRFDRWGNALAAGGVAVGGAALAGGLIDEDQAALLGGVAAAGVIREKGVGSWHPEAVTKLADAVAGGHYRARDPILRTNATRMISNWLNKYAGTAADPIKDLRLPDGLKWEDITDSALFKQPANLFKADVRAQQAYTHAEVKYPDWLKNTPDAEDVWSVKRPMAVSKAAVLKSYLSHAGDYARANIPPEKLAQYDLPRLIRETVANDQRIAAEAIKDFNKSNPVRISDTATMPEYKAYDPVEQPARKFSFNKDGSIRKMEDIQLPKGEVQYSWREIKLQEELTPEQMKRIRRLSGQETPDEILKRSGNKPGYVALDAKEKPIKDNFSERIAAGATPQEAHLAGQLAQEGNALGHCVGGYYNDVTNGSSRILSLRDQLGRSYATVEIQPPSVNATNFPRDLSGEWRIIYTEWQNSKMGLKGSVPMADWLKKNYPVFYDDLTNHPDSIRQIKGPGNGAPPDYVRPYVQDLVKSGKWGDVGDLEYTGLEDIQQSKINSKPYNALAEELYPGQRYLTKEEHAHMQDEGIKRTLAERKDASQFGTPDAQRGSADPKTLAKIAGAGIAGAALASQNALDEKEMLGLGLIGATAIRGKGRVDPIIKTEGKFKGLPESHATAAARFNADPAAFTQLYNENAKFVDRVINHFFRGSHSGALDDIRMETFEAFFKALQDPEGFTGQSQAKTWLYRTAKNKTLNEMRSKKVSASEELPDEGVEGEGALTPKGLATDVTPESIALKEELTRELSNAIDRLPPELGEPLRMAEFEGLPYAEIADRLGIQEGALRMRLMRAKERLGQVMKEFNPNPRTIAGVAAVSGGAALAAYLDPDFGEHALIAGAMGMTIKAGKSGEAVPRPDLALAGPTKTRALANAGLITAGATAGALYNEDSPIKTAIFGGGVAALLAGAHPADWASAIRRTMKEGPIQRIAELVQDTMYQKKVAKRAVMQMATRIVEAVPAETRRQAIYDHLAAEGPGGALPAALTPAELAIAGEAKEFYRTIGEAAVKAGVMDKMLEDYATRIYGKPSKGLTEKVVGGNVSLESPFAKPRGYKTRAEAEAAGYVPKTTDIAKVLEIYSESMHSAIFNKNFIETLRATVLPDGTKLVEKLGQAPDDYVYIGHPQLKQYRVHPDIAADMRFVFDAKSPGAIIGALDAINSTQKRMGVSASLFHVTALEQALAGGMSILKSPGTAIKALGQSFAPRIFGESLAVKMIKEGGAGDLVDYAMKSGLEFSMDRMGTAAGMEDVSTGMYKGLDATTKFLDATVPGLGKVTSGAFTKLNHMFDQAMWGRFHTTLKLETFADKSATLARNNARAVEAGKAELMSKTEIGRQAASFTNDLYGGLNWYGIVTEMNTRWGRELASAALGPAGRLGMRLMLFAPDWTISTTRAFVKGFGPVASAGAVGGLVGMNIAPNVEDGAAIGGVLGAVAGLGAAKMLKLKGMEGSGIRGALPEELGGRAQNMVDLHRQYFLRSALIYSTVIDALNVAMSGHHFWENEDKTRLDLGDGRTMQASKHFVEPFHWILDPIKQGMGKSSFLVKESMSQLAGTEYWSPKGAPRMGGVKRGEDISLPSRLSHATSQFTPISLSGMDVNQPEKSIASALGVPIYGKSYDEQAEAKRVRKAERATPEARAERKAKEIERRIRIRERGG